MINFLNGVRLYSIDFLITWFIPILIIVIWQIAVQSGWLSTRIMPAPLDVVNAGITLAISGELYHHFSASLERAVLGLLIGGSIGFFLGFI
ncbi:MAG: aliphatic sulfonate ABC transporter permease SsuC, partial [Sulfurimonadaceae bacterium]|nr:aliphatic sulfonate ABC transporter permease SsuC [Sulfurimonadaceae bacterium]